MFLRSVFGLISLRNGGYKVTVFDDNKGANQLANKPLNSLGSKLRYENSPGTPPQTLHPIYVSYDTPGTR